MQAQGKIELYHYQSSTSSWKRASPNVQYRFFDVNEDSEGPAQWSLEAGSMEIAVSGSYSYSVAMQKITLSDMETRSIWSLNFPDQSTAEAFNETFAIKLFENMFNKPHSDAAYQKVLTCVSCLISLSENLEHFQM